MKKIEHIEGSQIVATNIRRGEILEINTRRPILLSHPYGQSFRTVAKPSSNSNFKTHRINIGNEERLFIGLRSGVSSIQPTRGRTTVSMSAIRIPHFLLERDLFPRYEAKSDPLKRYFNNMCLNYLNGRPVLPKKGAPQMLCSYFDEAQGVHKKNIVKALKSVRRSIIIAP